MKKKIIVQTKGSGRKSLFNDSDILYLDKEIKKDHL